MAQGNILLEIDKLKLGWSGVEKTLIALRHLLKNNGFDVDVCCSPSKNISKDSFKYDFETIDSDDVDYNKYDVIILSIESHQLLDTIRRIGKSKAKIIKIVHGDPELLVERYDFDFLKMFQFYNLADKLIVLNESFRKVLPNDLRNKTRSIGHSFDFKNIMKESDSKKVTYVGRFDEPNKQVFKVLEVWNKIKEMVPDATFEIYGDGPSKNYYSKLIKKGKLRDVFLKDKTEDVYEVYKEAKVNILLSKHEGLPLAVLEGIDCGVAPLVSNGSKWTEDLILEDFKIDTNDNNSIVIAVVKILKLDLSEYNTLVFNQQNFLLEVMNTNSVLNGWKSILKELTFERPNEMLARDLNPYFNKTGTDAISESKLKKEYDSLFAKYQYALSLLAKNKK